MDSILKDIPDNVIREEYVQRFALKPGMRLASPQTAVDHLRTVFDKLEKDKEFFVVMILNAQNELIITDTLFTGTLTSSAVYPRELVKRVLEVHGAAIICSHCHPSGCLTPSASDRSVTKKLKTALESIDVELLDHIILGGTDSYSFSDQGLL